MADSMQPDARVYIAGHDGMVGSALVRALRARGFTNLIWRTRDQLELLDQGGVREFFLTERPDYVFLAAARVGGIMANNTFRADFIYENLTIAANVIHAAHESGVTKLLNLGSSCIYPRLAPQPLREEYLLTGELEPTNEPYAIAKIAAIKLCESYSRQYGRNFISVMPTNLYGPGDSFDLAHSHVLPALIRKCHEAKERADHAITVWGTGNPRREFLYVDDLADACVFVMERYDGEQFLNIGCGEDLTIRELAELVAEVVGYRGGVRFDTSKPDGTPRKLLDVSRLRALGWSPKVGLRAGITKAYHWFLEHAAGGVHAQAD
jgi:GDP-L-fucose synthase